MKLSKNGRLVGCAGGIFVCYFYFGILQERINRGNFGEGVHEERFSCTLALVFSQCVVNYLYAVLMSKTVLGQGEDTTKSSFYAICSLTYLVAMVASNKALLWVNYPTQVIGKSCKPIPTMILCVLVGRQRYPVLKYLFISMIVLGVALFMYKDQAAGEEDDHGMGWGEVLLLASLVCDGLTGAVQERIRTEHQTKSGHMMKSINKWSIGYLGLALVISGEGLQFVSFVQRHPTIIYQIALFSVTSALGQFFIYMVISEFGPLTVSIITTTRKFFTVLGSVIIFGTVLMTRQWIGVVFVFAGLILDGVYGKQKQKEKSLD